MRRKIYFRNFTNIRQAEEAEPDFWLSMKPEKRVMVVDSCLLDHLKLQGKSNERPPRLRRVCRIVKRASS